MLNQPAVLFIITILLGAAVIAALLVYAMKLYSRPRTARVKPPAGWHEGAFVQRGVASSSGSFLVVYHLLDDGEWMSKLKTYAFECDVYHMNGLLLSEDIRIYPTEGDTVLENFTIRKGFYNPFKAEV